MTATSANDGNSSTAYASSGGGGQSRRVLLITGEPGIGKSTLMCQLISSNQLSAPAFREVLMQFIPSVQVVALIESYHTDSVIASIHDRMIGYHICMASVSSTLDPMRFARSLAVQCCESIPGFSERFIQSDAGKSTLRGDDPILSLCSIYRLMAELPPLAVRCLLVDRLDESLCVPDPKQSVTALLAARETLNAMPEWLRIVAVSRPERDVFQHTEQWMKPLMSTIASNGDQNAADVASFVRSRLSVERASSTSASGDAIEVAIAKAVRLSAGNFLVASEIVRPVQSTAGGWSVAALQQIVNDTTLKPGDLTSYYTGFFTRQNIPKAEWGVLRIVIELLLASSEPVGTIELLFAVQLTHSADVRDDIKLEEYLHMIEPFLRRTTPEESNVVVIALYHKSFSDWLRTLPRTHRFAVDAAAGARRLAALGLLVSRKPTTKFERAIARTLLGVNVCTAPVACDGLRCYSEILDDGVRSDIVLINVMDRVVGHLLAAGVSASKWQAIGIVPLCYAYVGFRVLYSNCMRLIDNNDVQAVACVCNAWNDNDQIDQNLIRAAVRRGRTAIVNVLLDPKRVRVESMAERADRIDGYNELFSVARTRDMIDCLLASGCKPNASALCDVETRIAAEYLTDECKFDARTIKLFLVGRAFSFAPIEVLQFALSRHPDRANETVSSGASLLCECMTSGNVPTAELLLRYGANPNFRNSRNESVLSQYCKSLELFDLILEACDPALNPVQDLNGKVLSKPKLRANRIRNNPNWKAQVTGTATLAA